MGVPRVRPSKTPLRIFTASASRRWVVMRLWPGARRSSSGWMSSSERGRRGGQPSTTAPMAGPWDSPQVVTLKICPKVLPMRLHAGTHRQRVAGGVHHDGGGGGLAGPAFEGGGTLVDEHRETFER